MVTSKNRTMLMTRSWLSKQFKFREFSVTFILTSSSNRHEQIAPMMTPQLSRQHKCHFLQHESTFIVRKTKVMVTSHLIQCLRWLPEPTSRYQSQQYTQTSIHAISRTNTIPRFFHQFSDFFLTYLQFLDFSRSSRLLVTCTEMKWASSFLTAHKHILGYLVPYNGEKVIKM